MPRDDCFSNTANVHNILKSRRLNKEIPLYISANWQAADPAVAEAVLGNITASGYIVVTAPNGMANGTEGGGIPKEIAAMMEYELAMKAERFLGNSVEMFSALIIMQRRHKAKWAGHYNAEDIPLVMMMPLLSTPWVFTFNSWSPEYEPLVKVAVKSASKQGHIKAHCIFAGDVKSPIAKWLNDHKVTVHPHPPAWREAMLNATSDHTNPLLPSGDAVVSAWQRLDVPLISGVDQYSYVLYTDADVMFRCVTNDDAI